MLVLATSLAAQIVDRTVALVQDKAITQSEVLLQARLEAMTNGEEYQDSPERREEALDRLIDQLLIVNDIRVTGLSPLTDEERKSALEQLRLQMFGGLPFEQALVKYGIDEQQALDFFVRQIEFTRYVDFRFRTGQTVEDVELQALYTSKYGRTPSRDAPTFLQARAALRDEFLADKVEKLIDQHIRQLRVDNRVLRLAPINRAALAAQGDAP